MIKIVMIIIGIVLLATTITQAITDGTEYEGDDKIVYIATVLLVASYWTYMLMYYVAH